MSKQLIIAEKPSVAGDIARVLGGFKRHDDYFESDDFVLSSAVGHLVQIAVPEEFEVKRGKWSFANLPVIPPHFDLLPIEKSEARLKLLTKLLKRKDVTGVINACDAGREGELIFRYIASHAGSKKPVKRLWLQSMTAGSIKEGFKHLRSDEEMQPLADAAICRSESDWLVGINGTRAMTAFNSKSGGFHKTPVGRVQTPTLAILVEREEKIKRFVPKDYWEVHATFGVTEGDYAGRWIDEKFAKAKKDDESDAANADLRAERLWDAKRAEAIKAKCEGKPGEIEEESKPTTQASPLLFDLTSLQRAANGRFGFSARTTLSIAQALYEKHKVLTYPRTDARALPEDYLDTVKATLEEMSGTPYAPFAKKILKQGWIKPNKRIFNNAKISDHFAIIPTPQAPKALSEIEQKLYDLVVRQFLAVFYPSAEYMVTTRLTRVEKEAFKSEGKVLVNAGWLEVHGKAAAEDGDTPNLVAVKKGEKAKTKEINVLATQTKPPARFTEATLLSAMEGAGKLVEDEELRDAMKERGLGTPATRAVIIEKLLAEEYLVRLGRELQATPKAFSLITLLRGLEIPELASPEMTGEWEYKLKEMEHGKLKRDTFMREIAKMTRHIVERAKAHDSETVPGDYATLKAKCPKCGGTIKENYKKFQCENCDFSLWRILAGRQFEPAEIDELIAKKSIGPLQGFRSRLGRPFAANIKFTDDFQFEFDFGQANEDAEPVDFTGQESLGACPKCGGNVYAHGMAYLCEKAAAQPRTCDFRTGKIILQRNIEPEQVTKLLKDGKTDLLHKFISKKGRPFSAFLVRGAEGKVTFEFAPREAKAGTKTAAKTVGDKPTAKKTRARKTA
ncbi:MAG TPA: DNA topoisomerase III [Burkholderiales bacterium]|nr:DNA topoisomerase III [Burkholderiales bacterium]